MTYCVLLTTNVLFLLVLLDLSAAFDTIDHDILQRRLESTGVKSRALMWIYSCLSNRTQAVNINGTLSAPAPLHFGVPQISVLGPLLFTIYYGPITGIARNLNLMYTLMQMILNCTFPLT